MIKDFIIAAKNAESAKNLGRCPRPPKTFATFAFFAAKKLLAIALITFCSFVSNALPLVWRADWPDAKPVETLVHRGTDVELQPQWRINKEPADTNGWTYTTFCQTNAVGPWFGPLPGAFFSHTNDVGAAFYNVMVRAQTPGGAVNYTAFARLRMLDSPGYTPGALPLPAKSIDFADIEISNAPWPEEIAAATNAIPGTVSNIVTKTYIEDLGISGGGGTGDYDDLDNKPSINSVTLSGNKTSEALGLATLEEVSELGGEVIAKYTKPQGGIPASDMTQAVQASLGKADNSVQKTGAAAEAGQTIEGKLQIDSVTGIRVFWPGDGYWIDIGAEIGQVTYGAQFGFKDYNGNFWGLPAWKGGLLALVSDLADLRDKTDLAVYTYAPWTATGFIDTETFTWNENTRMYENDDPEPHTMTLSFATGEWYLFDGVDEWRTSAPYDATEIVFDSIGVTFTRSAVYDTSDTIAKVSQLPNLSVYAPLYSPAFTGTPTAPTPDAADNSTKVATTAFVKTAISGISVTPLSGRNFDFATTQGVMDALKATIEALGGTVTNAPTTPAQNNQIQGE